MISTTRTRQFGELRGVFRTLDHAIDRHRTSGQSAYSNVGRRRFRSDWFAERMWEDDGGPRLWSTTRPEREMGFEGRGDE
jgi:hypothetical protein